MGVFERVFGVGKSKAKEQALEQKVGELERSLSNFQARSSDFVSMAKLLNIDLNLEGERYSISQLEGIAAVLAIVRVYSDDLSGIPFSVIEKNDRRKPRTDLDAYRIITQKPSYYHTKSLFWKSFWWNYLIGGAGYAQIIRNDNYEPVYLRLWKWNEVSLLIDDSALDIEVAFQTPFGVVAFRDMIYLPANSLDGITPRTSISIAYDAHAESFAAQKHGKNFYQNGAKIPGVLTVPSRLSDAPGNHGKSEKEKAENARERLRENFTGITNTGKVPILEEGIDFKPFNMPMGDAQFVETRQFSFNQLCAIYGIPPALVQMYADSRYANAEQMDLSYVKHSLTPKITQLEEELLSKLIPFTEWDNVEVYGDMNYLLRGDITTQTEHDSSMLGRAVYSPNDILRRMKLPTFEGGDKRWMDAGMMPQDVAERYYGGKTNDKNANGNN